MATRPSPTAASIWAPTTSALQDPRVRSTRGGLVMCLDEATGKLLWQLIVPKFQTNLHEFQFRRYGPGRLLVAHRRRRPCLPGDQPLRSRLPRRPRAGQRQRRAVYRRRPLHRRPGFSAGHIAADRRRYRLEARCHPRSGRLVPGRGQLLDSGPRRFPLCLHVQWRRSLAHPRAAAAGPEPDRGGQEDRPHGGRRRRADRHPLVPRPMVVAFAGRGQRQAADLLRRRRRRAVCLRAADVDAQAAR